MLDFFTVGERIALYLARTCPEKVVGELVFEVSLLVEEDGSGPGDLAAAGGGAGAGSGADGDAPQDFAGALAAAAGGYGV